MISTEFYKGQGLGNQLWCYVTTRVLATKRSLEFCIQHSENFLGSDFMNLDPGKTTSNITNHYQEKVLVHRPTGSDVRMFDQNLIKIADNTKIDGCLQDEQYILSHKDEIRKWLHVKPEYEFHEFSKVNICVINFRGSGYVYDKDFFLPPRYWKNAIRNMRKINPDFKFIVITEDVASAKKFFPNFDVFHFSIAKDYVVIKNAKYLILSNSSFAWFPAWLSTDLRYCIAPKYWTRHNISDGYWSLGYNITTGWMYQDRQGNLSDYDTCLAELKTYMNENATLFSTEPVIPKSFEKNLAIWKAVGKDTSYIGALFRILFIEITKKIRSYTISNTTYKKSIPTLSTPGTKTNRVVSYELKGKMILWLKDSMLLYGYY